MTIKSHQKNWYIATQKQQGKYLYATGRTRLEVITNILNQIYE